MLHWMSSSLAGDGGGTEIGSGAEGGHGSGSGCSCGCGGPAPFRAACLVETANSKPGPNLPWARTSDPQPDLVTLGIRPSLSTPPPPHPRPEPEPSPHSTQVEVGPSLPAWLCAHLDGSTGLKELLRITPGAAVTC